MFFKLKLKDYSVKSQTTLEFTLITVFVVVVAIIFIGLYLKYSYNSATSITVSTPDFIQNFYPINITHSIITLKGKIPANSLNITFLFKFPTGNKTSTLSYNVLNSSKTQTGEYAYFLNLTTSSTYNPDYDNFSICNIQYDYQNKITSIININSC